MIIKEDPRNLAEALGKLDKLNRWTPTEARALGVMRRDLIAANREGLQAMVMNASTSTNTVSSALKLNVILDQSVRAFAIKTLVLSAFSAVFEGVRLAGTDKVSVPYFPLVTTASVDFNPANGYDTHHDSSSDAKEITVDKRKYQSLSVTSSERARQPFLNTAQNSILRAEQLGIDIVNDVLAWITAGRFSAAVLTSMASSFDSDDCATLKGIADGLNWSGKRALVLNSDYDVNLLKDSAIKNAMAFGDNGPVQEGRIMRISGFDYFPDARIPDNGESLQGFICSGRPILVAFSPIEPSPDVLPLVDYRVVVADNGCQLEYRRFGNATLDTGYELVEANYGIDSGEVAGLKRIVAPS